MPTVATVGIANAVCLEHMDHAPIRPYFLALATVLLIVLTIFLFRPFLVTLGLAAIVAVMLDPINQRLRRARLPRGGAAIITVLIGLFVILIALTIVGAQLLNEIGQLHATVSEPGSLAHLQSAITRAGISLDRIAPGAGAYLTTLSENLALYAHEALRWVLAHAPGAFSSTVRFILQLFVFATTLYYLLKEGGHLRRSIVRLSPLTEDETSALLSRLVRTAHSVVRGSLVIALIQGVLTALGFYVFGIPNSILWGTVTVFASLIPGVGSSLVVVPGAIYLLLTGHIGNGIGLALWGLLGIGLIDNVLRPFLLAGRSSVHPLLILLAVLGGLALFGPGGIFLGPLIVSLLIGLLSIYAPEREEEAAA